VILEVAARLFAEKGFEATTVRQIADAADLTSGSLFHHYVSKREMLVKVVEEGTLRTQRTVAERLADLTDPEQRLRELVATHLASLHQDTWRPFMIVSATEWLSLTPEERAPIVATRDAYEQTWREVLADAAEAGLVRDDPLVRLFLLGALNWTLFWYDPDAGLSIPDLAGRFCAQILPADARATAG
jgi:AcrR family transcriptional regulator